jgi:hypothetical protein
VALDFQSAAHESVKRNEQPKPLRTRSLEHHRFLLLPESDAIITLVAMSIGGFHAMPLRWSLFCLGGDADYKHGSS